MTTSRSERSVIPEALKAKPRIYAICKALEKAGSKGLTIGDLAKVVYPPGSDVPRDPVASIRVAISQSRDWLRETHGLEIPRVAVGERYRLIRRLVP